MNEFFTKLKTKVEPHKDIILGTVIGSTVAIVAFHRAYHPKGQIAMQFPKGVLERMISTDTGVVIALDNGSMGWLAMKHYVERPNGRPRG